MRRKLTLVAMVPVIAAIALPFVSRSPAQAAVVESRFIDDDWSVHEPNINALADAGVTKGCNPPANTRFCPSDAVTRGEMAAFLVRAFGYRERAAGAFVDDDGIFEADIERIAAAAITKGCNPPQNTRFCPDQPVTRAQMATLLGRALGLAVRGDGPFADVASSVHRESINAIAAAGITKGCNPPQNTLYCPQRPVTRAEMATFLVRALDLDPEPNRLAVAAGASCNRAMTACSSSIELPVHASFVISEGWYQVLPYAPGEEAGFRGADTGIVVTLDGTTVSTAMSEQEQPGYVTREWRATVSALGPGTHTLRVAWRWEGRTDRVAVVKITVR